MRSHAMTICPKCGHHTPTTNEKLRGLSAARVGMVAKVNRRSLDAAANELATDVVAAAINGDALAIRSVVRHAEDYIDPSRACPEPRRAVGFIEFKPGEEPERFDEFTGPMGGGL